MKIPRLACRPKIDLPTGGLRIPLVRVGDGMRLLPARVGPRTRLAKGRVTVGTPKKD